MEDYEQLVKDLIETDIKEKQADNKKLAEILLANSVLWEIAEKKHINLN